MKTDRFNDGINEASTTMHNSVSELIQSNIVDAQSEWDVKLAEATLLSCHGAIAGVELVAMMTARKPNLTKSQVSAIGDQIAVDLITPDTMMFAALFVGCMHKGVTPTPGSSSNATMTTEFGPSIFLEAMQAFEKVMGFKPDKFLEPGLVKVARELEETSVAPLAAFMAKKQESKNKPLN